MNKKTFLHLIFLIGSMYAPLELSRLIIWYWSTYGLEVPFYLELIWLWIGFIGLWWLWLKEVKDDKTRTNVGTAD